MTLQDLYTKGMELLATIRQFDDPSFEVWKEQLMVVVINLYGNKSREYNTVANSGLGLVMLGTDDEDDLLQATKDEIQTLLNKIQAWIAVGENTKANPPIAGPITVFLVYGHDKNLCLKVEKYLLKNHIEYIKLDEEPNAGRTIIDKFESEADKASCAICLLTGSDDDQEIRDNVLFEMGFFAGRLGRDRIIPVSSSKENLPSDLHGIGYVDVNDLEKGLDRELGHILKGGRNEEALTVERI